MVLSDLKIMILLLVEIQKKNHQKYFHLVKRNELVILKYVRGRGE